MNFLLHRHLAERELASPNAGIGAMLPDLWRMADRRVRPARGGLRADSDTLGEVLSGIEHHVESDRWFHRAAIFTDGERRTAELLRGAGIGAPRIGMFAHVIWELCLDGALLRKVGLAATVDALRRGFAETDATSDEAAALHHWDRAERSAEERAVFELRMRRLREELARGPWIDGYQDGDGLALRVAGVRARLGFEPMTHEDRERLGEVLARLAEEAIPALEALLGSRA